MRFQNIIQTLIIKITSQKLTLLLNFQQNEFLLNWDNLLSEVHSLWPTNHNIGKWRQSELCELLWIEVCIDDNRTETGVADDITEGSLDQGQGRDEIGMLQWMQTPIEQDEEELSTQSKVRDSEWIVRRRCSESPAGVKRCRSCDDKCRAN